MAKTRPNTNHPMLLLRPWGRKGQTEEDSGHKMVSYVCTVLIIGFAVVGFAIFLAYLQTADTTLKPQVEKLILTHRLLGTSECFAYQDLVSGRVMPRVIDTDKFTQERLDSCHSPDTKSPLPCYQLQLSALGDAFSIVRELETANWVHCKVTRQRPATETEYVLIMEEGVIQQGLLRLSSIQ